MSTLELSQRSPLNGLQSGKPLILHILRLTTLFLGLRLFQKEAEIVKEWAEHYRTVKKRTARSETTKDKAGALPPAVCEKAKSGTWIGSQDQVPEEQVWCHSFIQFDPVGEVARLTASNTNYIISSGKHK
ncbi:hypothetical protein pdam_00022302 [Pocillopora damicornis]|uniref:Uncharacterized protein n=1 Tax=Pocillopora damicornis TaxID=46731 RepID=A0A3M6TEU3_POCDA|nr:hypothetical protein pdam_00022302 [Pocillopora damicornis]